ncbi:PepSY domain-containing protein [Pseudorhodoferax sp.]|uniref:PepSY domain-containing protein n=1 Tax=Pseudorhodoferax sp. TaxID=1993553 RepID=UPI0039E60A23
MNADLQDRQQPPARRLPRIGLRDALFQIHWCIGIVAGTVLMLMGLTGAMLTFEDELLDLFNPGILVLAPEQARRPALAPPELLQALPALPAGQSVSMLTLWSDPQRTPRLLLVQGPTRLPAAYLDPATGAWLGPAAGQGVFDVAERLHRWLLLPSNIGKTVTGTMTLGLVLLLASGVYLRWPRRASSARAWLTFNPRLKGRPFLWSLHAVVATWMLPAWIILSATGIYWAFDPVRKTVDGWAGVQRPPRVQRQAGPPTPPGDISAAWQAFRARVPAWEQARLRLPARASDPLEVFWLAPGAEHSQQTNQMQIGLDGEIRRDQRFADRTAAQRALATIYPLHIGEFFGLPGRIAMMLAALALPLLGVTGWWLYLQRRRRRRSAAAERRALDGAGDGAEFLVAWAGQTGRAESLATRTARALQGAGHAVALRPLAALMPADLAGYPRALLVASTFGEGEAPDAARRFAAAIARGEARLAGLQYAVLALGNREYAHFCAFGHWLHRRLGELGASALQPAVPVCDSDPRGVDPWFSSLARFGADPAAAADEDGGADDALAWQDWSLRGRTLLNPGSVGEPLYELDLAPPADALAPAWAPGALVEILPPDADAADPAPGEARDALPRRYSVASIREDGRLQLIVRRHRHADGIGWVSGHLTGGCAPGGTIRLRLVANPAFTVSTDPQPCLFIGNGSGLAGLRGLLRERVRRGLGDNWLVFGERNQGADRLCADELGDWQARGLVRVDRVFSRDPGGGYVQDHLRARMAELRHWLLDRGAVVHVCGSLRGMAGGVEDVLRDLLGSDGLAALAAEGRYRRDVY